MDVVLYSLWSSNYTRRITGENLDTICIDFFDLMALYDSVTRLKMERNGKRRTYVSYIVEALQNQRYNYILRTAF